MVQCEGSVSSYRLVLYLHLLGMSRRITQHVFPSPSSLKFFFFFWRGGWREEDEDDQLKFNYFFF